MKEMVKAYHQKCYKSYSLSVSQEWLKTSDQQVPKEESFRLSIKWKGIDRKIEWRRIWWSPALLRLQSSVFKELSKKQQIKINNKSCLISYKTSMYFNLCMSSCLTIETIGISISMVVRILRAYWCNRQQMRIYSRNYTSKGVETEE